MKEVNVEAVAEVATLRVTSPANAAAGFGATVQVVKQWQQHLGFRRGWTLYRNVNQHAGFDCPGCAWPEPDEARSSIEFCENGAKAIGEEATNKPLTSTFFARHSIADLSQQSDYWLGQQGRLTEPMYRAPGATHYTPIEWERAYDLIASRLQSMASPDRAVFYASGRASNEAAFLYQLLARQLGTNNLPDSSNLCHESSGVALKEAIGIGKGTVSLADFAKAKCVLVIGQNPGTNHPRMLGALEQTVKNGGKIISINPLQEAGLKALKHPKKPWHTVTGGVPLASEFVQIKVNGDIALFKGIAKAITHAAAADGVGMDHDFIAKNCTGFDDYISALATVSWADIECQSGISKAEIERIADIIRSADSVIACWAMGITQHVNAVANIQEIVNVLLLGGNIGRDGAGVCPVRGHSNVQGDRTMGVTTQLPQGWDTILTKEFGITAPQQQGLDAIAAIEAMQADKVDCFVALGGNFQSACPDTHYTSAALRKVRLTVQIATKLNRSHLVTGLAALLLPCFGRTDRDEDSQGNLQWVTTENSMGYVTRSQGVVPPLATSMRSEMAIICSIAQRLFPDCESPAWRTYAKNYNQIRHAIAKFVPTFGEQQARLQSGLGFYLPNPVRDNAEFTTASARANFFVHPLTEHHHERNQFQLMTLRSHDQFNTTIYGLDDRYRGVFQGRHVVFMNAADMIEQGYVAQQEVDIIADYPDRERIAVNFRIVPYNIPQGSLAAYYPETNVLVPIHHVADKSHTPASKSVRVRLRASQDVSPN